MRRSRCGTRCRPRAMHRRNETRRARSRAWRTSPMARRAGTGNPSRTFRSQPNPPAPSDTSRARRPRKRTVRPRTGADPRSPEVSGSRWDPAATGPRRGRLRCLRGLSGGVVRAPTSPPRRALDRHWAPKGTGAPLARTRLHRRCPLRPARSDHRNPRARLPRSGARSSGIESLTRFDPETGHGRTRVCVRTGQHANARTEPVDYPGIVRHHARRVGAEREPAGSARIQTPIRWHNACTSERIPQGTIRNRMEPS